MKARLLNFSELAPEVRHLVFEAPEAERLDFLPGQFVSFTELLHGRKVTRAYSIASAPSGNRFELCLNLVKDGAFSPHLFEMRPGDEVDMKGPLGHFVPRQPFRDCLLVATGTGIAPFRSYLLSPEIQKSDKSITLLCGARYESGLLYSKEFDALSASLPSFQYLTTITRPESAWTGRTGRVQQHIEEALAGRIDLDVYICGLRAMVDDVRQILKDKGFEKPQIIYEKYD